MKKIINISLLNCPNPVHLTLLRALNLQVNIQKHFIFDFLRILNIGSRAFYYWSIWVVKAYTATKLLISYAVCGGGIASEKEFSKHLSQRLYSPMVLDFIEIPKAVVMNCVLFICYGCLLYTFWRLSLLIVQYFITPNYY